MLIHFYGNHNDILKQKDPSTGKAFVMLFLMQQVKRVRGNGLR